MTMSAKQAYTAALIGGAALWQITAVIGARREAWDSPLYWMVAYPLVMVLSGVMGNAHPIRPWRFALAAMWIQPVMMVVSSGSDWSLLPLGLILFGILAVPPICVATVSGQLKRKRTQAGA